jgi:hypothetical protein
MKYEYYKRKAIQITNDRKTISAIAILQSTI